MKGRGRGEEVRTAAAWTDSNSGPVVLLSRGLAGVPFFIINFAIYEVVNGILLQQILYANSTKLKEIQKGMKTGARTCLAQKNMKIVEVSRQTRKQAFGELTEFFFQEHPVLSTSREAVSRILKFITAIPRLCPQWRQDPKGHPLSNLQPRPHQCQQQKTQSPKVLDSAELKLNI